MDKPPHIMSRKTNKSFSKRVKVTGTGKLLTRTPGKNHYNAKQTRTKLNSKQGETEIAMPAKVIINNLPHINR